MCALTGDTLKAIEKTLRGVFTYKIFSVTHDRIVYRPRYRGFCAIRRLARSTLSPLDQDVIYWRKFASAQCARPYEESKNVGQRNGFPDESEEFNMPREAF